MYTVTDMIEEERVNSPLDYDPEDYLPEQDPDREYVFED